MIGYLNDLNMNLIEIGYALGFYTRTNKKGDRLKAQEAVLARAFVGPAVHAYIFIVEKIAHVPQIDWLVSWRRQQQNADKMTRKGAMHFLEQCEEVGTGLGISLLGLIALGILRDLKPKNFIDADKRFRVISALVRSDQNAYQLFLDNQDQFDGRHGINPDVQS